MAASISIFQPQIPIFTGKNYDFWEIKRKTLFCSQDVWDLVENGFAKPPYQTTFQALTQGEKDQRKDNKKRMQKLYF